MRIELSKILPGRLNEGFDYLREVDHWPNWYAGMVEITGLPHGGRWTTPGDTVSFDYIVLGRRLEGTVVLAEMREYESVKSVVTVSSLPEVHQEHRYTEVSDDSFLLDIILETQEATSFRGRVVDQLLLPRVMERDLSRTLENLEDIFATGLPRPMWWP